MVSYNFFYKRLLHAGGAERLLINLYKEFKKKSFSVKIITYEFNSKSKFFKLAFDSNDLVILNGHNIKKAYKLRKYLKNNRSYNLIHSGYLDFYIATLFTKIKFYTFKHQPSAMSFNETDKFSFINRKFLALILKNNPGAEMILDKKNSLTARDLIFINIRSIFSALALKKAKNIFVLSDFSKKEKLDLYNVNSTVIQGALDRDVKYYSPNVKNEFKTYEKIFITVCRLDKNKRLDLLLESFAEYKKNKNYLLLICGTGDQKDSLIELSKKLNIFRSVRFLGFVSDADLIIYYNISDLFISIDWADFRITQFEALASNTPVLISNETDKNLEEYFKITGYYQVTSLNKSDIIQSINRALDSKKDFNILNEKLERFYWHKYSLQIHNSIIKS